MLTNNYNTPSIMLDVLEDDVRHDVGSSDYSATSLVLPPRLLQLKKRYGHQIIDDARDRWHLFLGSALHEYIEKKLKRKPDKYIVEHKITEFVNDRKVVAIPDAYELDTKTVYDHKSCTQWQWNSEHKLEYEQQLNINAWFLRQCGYHPERGALTMLTKDWTVSALHRMGPEAYPPNPMWVQDIPIWSEQEQEDFINARLDLHKECEEMSDEELPLCTDEDMWAQNTKWAVMAPGVYKAKKLAGSEQEAKEWIANSRLAKPNWYIEKRPGRRTRCEDYCPVKRFCSQYKEMSA